MRREDRHAGTGAPASHQGGDPRICRAAGGALRPPRHAQSDRQLRGRHRSHPGPYDGPHPSEEEFANHLLQTVASDLEGEWIFIVDNLNTHQSESLVHLVAVLCDLDQDLGKKGRRGILRSCATRADFLADSRHRIRFVYTPKRASWLNQIELWFSILVRRLLKRASFSSVEQLKERVLSFIEYFNRTRAKPFQWTYTGKALMA